MTYIGAKLLEALTTSSSSSSGGGVTISDTSPSSPSAGDQWFNSSDLKMYIYYNDGSSAQWVQSSPSGDVHGTTLSSFSVGSEGSASGDGAIAYNNSNGVFTYTPPLIGGSTTVYANTSNLPSTASATTGDMAFVTANTRFYVFNGSAWYSVALTNTAPTVTGASASYTLATNGSATVVTLSSSDPEGDPLTFSHTTSGLVNEATIVQGTGSNTNVFTVTPSTNDSHGGSFTVTFSATDGANVVNANSSFSLQFASPKHSSTSLHMTTSGNNGRTNSVFDDASTSNHTLTSVGDVFQTSLSPHSYAWSNYFAGAGATVENVVFGHASDFVFGTNEWCVESWIFCEGHQAGSFSQGNIWGMKQGADQRGVNLHMQSNGNFMVLIANGTTWTIATDTAIAVPISKWTHVALTKNTTTNKVYLWVDGREAWSAAHTGSIANSNNKLAIGGTITGTYSHSFKGYISNFRVVVGDDVYTSGFKPPLDALTPITGTKLLTCNSKTFEDNSGGNAKTITFTNTPEVSTKTPLTLPDKWKPSVGGSAYFDGNGDRIELPTSSDFSFNTGDFSINFWMNCTGTNTANATQNIMDFRNGTNGFNFYITAARELHFAMELGGNGVGNTTVFHNVWNHVSVNRESGSLYFAVNGVVIASGSNTNNFLTTGGKIGDRWNSSPTQYYKGHLSDVSFVKGNGNGRTGAFTPPTSLTSVVSNTKLKLNFDQTGVFDSVSKSFLQLKGDAQESTTQTKYATTNVKLNGTGYTTSTDPSLNIRQGEFQIELWAYRTSSTGSEGFFHLSANPIGSSTDGIALYSDSSFNMWLYHNGYTNTGTSAPANQWNHHVVIRKHGRLQAFLNGTRHTDIASTHDFNGSTMNVGQMYTTGNTFTGYIEDFRYLQHHTTYPFERPQEALTAVSGTTLQFANASTIPSSPNGLTVTASEGTPTVSGFTPPDSTVSHSIYYDGSDMHTVSANTNIHLGTGDFTIEGYFYIVSFVGSYGALFGTRAANDTNGFGMSYTASNMYVYSAANIINNIPFEYKKWMHLAYQRKTIGGTSTHQMFRDGVLVGSGTTARTYANNPLYIGGDLGGNENAHAYISDFRVVKGTAIYDSSFTPPTGAL